MRTIRSSKFSTEKPYGQICSRLWMSLVLSAIRGSLWRSLPLFRVKKFNSQEMDGRTLKVEIAKSGAGVRRRVYA